MVNRSLVLLLVGLFASATFAKSIDAAPKESQEPKEPTEPTVTEPRPRYHVDILRHDPETDELVHICDGAILDSHHIITAAHCVVNEKIATLYVRSGADTPPPANMDYKEERLFSRVRRMMYPKDYVATACRHHEHDIAILKVQRAFDLAYDRLYRQVNLPEPINDFEDYQATISGYSKEKLNTLVAKVISNEECTMKATSIVTQGNICGVFTPKAPQYNTEISGSPLVHGNTIIGILNAANSCSEETKSIFKCVPQAPELRLYTRVTAYLDFIEKVLNHKAAVDIVYIP